MGGMNVDIIIVQHPKHKIIEQNHRNTNANAYNDPNLGKL